MIEVWAVNVGGNFLRFKSKEKAEETATLYKDASIHHLIEAREKVWVVRDHTGRLRGVAATETYARAAYWDGAGYTCREEWLGGES